MLGRELFVEIIILHLQGKSTREISRLLALKSIGPITGVHHLLIFEDSLSGMDTSAIAMSALRKNKLNYDY